LLAALATYAKSQLRPIALSKKIYGGPPLFSPSVQWDGHYVTISSVSASIRDNDGDIFVYQLSISGNRAKVVGTTKLIALKPNRHAGQTWIEGGTIVGIDYRHHEGWVSYWAYPKGGEPIRNIRHIVSDFGAPLVGVTVSVTSSR
jgi:hypothetical protein